MRIEKINENQIAEIARLEKEIFPDPWSEKGLLDTLRQPQAVMLGAWLAEEFVGYIILYYVLDEGEIARIAVSSSFRRIGAAGKLLEETMNFCRQNKIEKLMLDVRESNIPALTFYKKYGFMQDGIRKRFYTNPSEDAILMSRKIK